MSIEGRLSKLETAVNSGDGPTLFELLGIHVLEQEPEPAFSDEEIRAMADRLDSELRPLLERLPDFPATTTPQELAEALIEYRRAAGARGREGQG